MTPPQRIGAFFDLDGTVVAPPSLEWRFVGFLLAREELATRNIAQWLTHFVERITFDPRGAILENKHYLAGLRTSLAVDWESSLAERMLMLYAPALDRMAWHWAQGHRVFLVSGTLDFLARALAPYLPVPVEACATQLETCGSCWTGRLTESLLSGEAKARAARNLAARFGISLWDSYAYGNSTSDLPMLDSVGQRFAVNPLAALRRIASSEGWPICDWRELARKAPSPNARFAAREA